MRLEGRTAIITGGAHRVGGAITTVLASHGPSVVIHYGRSADAAEQLAEDIRSSGGSATLVQADLRDPGAPSTIFDAAPNPVSILINSAAGFPEDKLGSLDREKYRSTMTLNLESPVFLTNELAARLPADMDGAVVNVTDWRVARPYGNHFSYLIAKGGLVTLTKAAAIHLAPRVRVNAVALGAILPPPGEGDEYLENLVESIPVRRAGGTDVVVSAVIELLTNDFVTGQVWRLDGGASLT